MTAAMAAAVSGAAWFDFFLTVPLHTFAIDTNDVEVAVLLASTSQIVAGQMSTVELVDHVATSITGLLGIDARHFVSKRRLCAGPCRSRAGRICERSWAAST